VFVESITNGYLPLITITITRRTSSHAMQLLLLLLLLLVAIWMDGMATGTTTGNAVSLVLVLACPGSAWSGPECFNGNRRRRGTCFCLSVYLANCRAVGLFDYFVAGSNNQVSSVIINISSSSCNNVIIGVLSSLSHSLPLSRSLYRCLLTWPIARRAQKATLFWPWATMFAVCFFYCLLLFYAPRLLPATWL